MNSASSRSRHLETAISIFLLAILFLIGLAVFVKQSDFDMSHFGIGDAPSLSAQVSETGMVEKPAFDFPLPAGFKRPSEAETYTPENLYEKINGKAPLYIESGFVKLFTQRFVSQNDSNFWFEIFLFDMASARNAFSVYSVQRRADVETWSAVQFGYRTSNALYFVRDRFYVELVGSSEAADLSGAMADAANNLAGQIGVSETIEIPELALFPQDNFVPGSAKLYLSGVFGFEGLSNTFVCRYKIDEESVTAFISKRPSPQDARTAAENYFKFLIDNGGTSKTASIDALNEISGKVLDFYGTTEIIFAVGPYVAGVHEAKTQKSAEKLAVQLINKLTDIVRTTKND